MITEAGNLFGGSAVSHMTFYFSTILEKHERDTLHFPSRVFHRRAELHLSRNLHFEFTSSKFL